MIQLSLVCGLVCQVGGTGWPEFRGPKGQGQGPANRLPIRWSEQDNLVWKQPIPGLGWSSPVVQNDRLWITSALDDGRSLRVLCLDCDTGSILKNVEVFQKPDPGRIHRDNSHASPTPILHSDRVYVHYGAHGTACLTTDGVLLWKNDQLKHNHRHGPGGSPVLYDDLLIVNCDGIDVQYIVGLDKDTGKVRWKTFRKHISKARRDGSKVGGMAFTTPLLISVDGRPQLVSAGSDHVAGYDPKTGEEIWWSEYDGYSLVPRPVFGNGLVYACSGFNRPVLYAVKPTGQGNVTKTHVVWTLRRQVPLNPSPLLVGEELYIVSDRGVATCLDSRTGKQHWQQRLGGNFYASPVYAGGHIYWLNRKGGTTVTLPGKTFQQVAVNSIDGYTWASPAVYQNSLYLRTDKAVYRIE